MKNFVYNTPTQVVFGRDTEGVAGELVAAQNCKKVLVHYGSGSVVRSGLLQRIYDSLDAAGVSYVSLGGVVPNPRLSKVYEGIELCRSEGVDFILAVGGGSVIDSAKAIGYGVANEGDVWDFYMARRGPAGCLPVGAILTIAAAGSEMSNSSVITSEEGWLKRSCNTEYGRCRFAIMNPELTFTLPDYQTQSGCVDILMHTMERYFETDPTMPLTDAIAEALMRRVLHNARILKAYPDNYDARAEVMWASSLSHNGLTGCGGSGGDWSCHQLEHELGGMFDVAHGAGLAAVWGSWARYVCKADVARFAQFAVNVMECPADFRDLEFTAMSGITALEAFFKSMAMPTCIADMGVTPTDEQMEELAFKCSHEKKRTIGRFVKLGYEDMKAIFETAR